MFNTNKLPAHMAMERKGGAPRGTAQPWVGGIGLVLGTILLLSNAGILTRDATTTLKPSLFLLCGLVLTDAAAQHSPPTGLVLLLYLMAVALHVALPSPRLPHPVLTPMLSTLLPLLPAELQYPANSEPLPLPEFFPSVLLISLSLPMLLQVIPQPCQEKRLRFALYLSMAIVAAFGQAAYTRFHGIIPMSLYDVAVYVPFRLHYPAFLVGVMLARLLQSSTTSFSLPAGSSGLLHGCGILFASAAGLLIVLSPSSLYGPQLLLVSLSLLVYCVSFTPLRSHALPTLDSSELDVVDRHFSRNFISMIYLSAYALQNPVWRLLSRLLCSSNAKRRMALCTTTDRYDWLRASGSAFQTRPSLYIFLVVLSVVATTSGYLLVLIVDISKTRFDDWLPTHLLSQTSLNDNVDHPYQAMAVTQDCKPCQTAGPPLSGTRSKAVFRKPLGAAETAVRLVIYYGFMTVFMITVWRLSVPITFNLSRLAKHPFFCLPLFRKCPPKIDQSDVSTSMMKASEMLMFFVDALRWTSILCLPAMIFNTLGHVVYPRIIWKNLRSVPDMLLLANNNPAEHTLVHGAPRELDLDFVIYVRYVTRGNNPLLVGQNARDASIIFRSAGVPDDMFVVEIVTDKSLKLQSCDLGNAAVHEIVVPHDYHPPGGALYKARALNYAILASPARDRDWIVHLDEETRFDEDTVAAIVEHCARQNYNVRIAKTQEWPSIGQGPIVYGRSMVSNSGMPSAGLGNWVTTLADSSRVSDDCGRYRVQYENGEVWVGMHGSFVVAGNCVEKAVTFDHGVEGSIAEDAFFAMLARTRSVQFAWIDAFMYEQSPFTFEDFIKQRARWLVGGLKVCSSSRIPFHVRSGMLAMTGLWSLMPFTYFSLILAILFGNIDPTLASDQWYYHLILPLMASMSVWSYIFGFLVTFKVKDFGVFGYVTLLYIQLALTPVFGLMEVCSVAYALWNFSVLSVAFHVVQKQGGNPTSELHREPPAKVIPADIVFRANEGTPLLNGR
jgi:beta-1,4-mannosyltransferase